MTPQFLSYQPHAIEISNLGTFLWVIRVRRRQQEGREREKERVAWCCQVDTKRMEEVN